MRISAQTCVSDPELTAVPRWTTPPLFHTSNTNHCNLTRSSIRLYCHPTVLYSWMDSLLLDEDDLAAAILLAQNLQAPPPADLFADENIEPEFSDVGQNNSRKRPQLPWILLQRFQGHEAHDEAAEQLLSVAGKSWQDAAARTSQRGSVQRKLPHSAPPRTLKNGNIIAEFKCPLSEVIFRYVITRYCIFRQSHCARAPAACARVVGALKRCVVNMSRRNSIALPD